MAGIKKIDHIGIAVKDVAAAARFYAEALGLEAEHVEFVDSQKVKVAFLPVGDVNLELVEATSPDSAIARHIEKRGEGIQHLGFQVEGIDDLLAALAARGAVVGSPAPVPGAHGTRVGFLHPKATGGVLIELLEKPSEGDG